MLLRCLFATQAEHEYKIQIQIEIQRKNRNIHNRTIQFLELQQFQLELYSVFRTSH